MRIFMVLVSRNRQLWEYICCDNQEEEEEEEGEEDACCGTYMEHVALKY